MEHCILISNSGMVSFWNERYRRLYFGNEFCSHLIPSIVDLNAILDFIEKKNIDFSLVSGYVTNQDIKKYESLLNVITKRKINTELVINDWGLFELARDFPLEPVLGRLLSKQKKSPHLLKVFNQLPDATKRRYRSVAINANFVNFLVENNVKRIEFDNLLQGIELDNKVRRYLSFSLYVPYGYIATTRLCPSNIYNQRRNEALRIPLSCAHDCHKGYFILSHPNMPCPLILKGNTVFYKKEDIGLFYEDDKIDRIVFQPDLPI